MLYCLPMMLFFWPTAKLWLSFVVGVPQVPVRILFRCRGPSFSSRVPTYFVVGVQGPGNFRCKGPGSHIDRTLSPKFLIFVQRKWVLAKWVPYFKICSVKHQKREPEGVHGELEGCNRNLWPKAAVAAGMPGFSTVKEGN